MLSQLNGRPSEGAGSLYRYFDSSPLENQQTSRLPKVNNTDKPNYFLAPASRGITHEATYLWYRFSTTQFCCLLNSSRSIQARRIQQLAIPQFIAAGQVDSRPLLPSFFTFLMNTEFLENDLLLAWEKPIPLWAQLATLIGD